MRAVVQRVSHARVEVGGEVVGAIEQGLAVLVGIAPGDTSADARALATKLAGLRIFFGDNMSLKDRHRRQDPDSYMALDLTATQQAAATAKSQSGTSQPCPFTPAQNLSNCRKISLNLDSFPMGGFQLVAIVPPPSDRYSQCSKAGYNSKGNPGPASCGCSAAFQAHSACHTY